jgi:cytochrome c-type protein NapB
MAKDRLMPDRSGEDRARLLTIIASVIGAAALIGFITGTRDRTYEPVYSPVQNRPAKSETDIPDARSHTELASRAWGANEVRSGWKLASARSSVKGLTDPASLEAARSQGPSTAAALSARQNRRAFDGAPPVIPHAVAQGDASECLACHANGFQLGSAVARPIPHARLDSCTQCHVVADAPFARTPPSDAAIAVNTFAAARVVAEGGRSYAGAPPVIPHSTWMRENCLACHGSAGAAGLLTRHPERQSCTQCHAPSAGLEQGPVLAPGKG